MPDWPKHFLDRADAVTVESEGHIWKMDGATFVRCLESGGWKMGEQVRCAPWLCASAPCEECPDIDPFLHWRLCASYYGDICDGVSCRCSCHKEAVQAVTGEKLEQSTLLNKVLIDIATPANICQGSCDPHEGAVRTVRVVHPNHDWGDFQYCDTAVEEDRSRGMEVTDVA